MTQRPKIAILASFPVWLVNKEYPAAGNHYATWLPSLCDAFAEQQDFEIHWIILRPNQKKVHHFTSKKQNFHVLPRTKKTLGLYSLYLHDRWLIRKTLQQIKPQLVHAWGNEDCYGLAGGDFKGAKLLSIQGLIRLCVKLSPMAKFEQRHSLYEAYSIQRYKEITGESPYCVEHAKKINPTAHIQQFDYAVESHFFEHQRELSKKPTFLFAGTGTPRKNAQLLIKAFSSPLLQHCELKLAGIPPNKDFPDNIIGLGRVSRTKMAELMAETWGLLIPSLTETGPTVAKEARVMGLPVILSTECGCQQYVKHGESGFVISPQDLDGMIQSILELAHSKEKNLQMGSVEQNQIRSLLTAENMYLQIRFIYNRIINTTV